MFKKNFVFHKYCKNKNSNNLKIFLNKLTVNFE